MKKESSVCNCVNIRRAAQSVTEIYDRYLSESGLKIGQFSMLNHINAMSPVNVSRLAEKMRLDRTTLVRGLKALENEGYIIDASEKGTRSRSLALTPTGEKALEKAVPLWEQAQKYLEDNLGTDTLKEFTSLLSEIESLTD
ncbi:MarR family winged helix-turn-helix transcriptional regulator [Seleniivibrio woodruffii]|uniref:MarR family winged helix-turn-helix transcriptional regulator n=1 Tax=Seleniivibrio woodruffii TaxID=1078050 RepID=UPI0026EFFBF6|nr:MarR family winged helix-turn-helix transcriptional regulator [Seleniivibrio woodruffii]